MKVFECLLHYNLGYEYLLVYLSCHKAIELVIPCVGGQNTSLKPDFLTALREP